MEYYIFNFIIKERNFYCIAYMADKDGFIEQYNILKSFSTINESILYCKNHNIILEDEEVSFCNVDEVIKEFESIKKLMMVECDKILWFWNTIENVAYSIDEYFYGDDNGDDNEILYVYNQLFYGTNPKSMLSDEDELYYPKWDKEDIQIIKDVVIDGIRILGKALDINLMKEYKLIK